jgi:hypothetical protein
MAIAIKNVNIQINNINYKEGKGFWSGQKEAGVNAKGDLHTGTSRQAIEWI